MSQPPHVVLVPGLGLTQRAWAQTAAHLPAGSADVLRLPGYGLPAHRRTDLRPEALADTVVEELARRGLDRVVLAGHSASCQVVAEAATRSDRVRGLLLVGPTTDPRARTWPALMARWLATARHESPSLLAPLTPQYLHTGLLTMARAMDAARRNDIEAALTQLTVPIVLVRGPHDRIAPSDWAQRLRADPRGTRPATLVTTPDGAHMVPMTDGASVARAIRHLVLAAT